MDASVPASSTLSQPPSEIARDEPTADHEWEPGPDLKRPGWLKCRFSILRYALKFHRTQIVIMFCALALLVVLVLKWNVLRPPMQSQGLIQMAAEIVQGITSVLYSPMFFQNAIAISAVSPSNWVDWWIRVQSSLGIGTLLVALFVWYGEIREDWENSLPKRMSVFFLHKGLPAIVCRYIWLAGESDLRAWGQQVAAQAARERFLNFYPNVKALAPDLAVGVDGAICRHYTVCFELMDDNPFLKTNQGRCFYQNMATGSCGVSSVSLEALKKGVSASVFPFN